MTSSPAEGGDFDILQWLQENWKGITCSALTGLNEQGLYAAIAHALSKQPVKGLQWLAASQAAAAAMAIAGCGDPEAIPDDPAWEPDAECNEVDGAGTLFCKVQQEDGITRTERSYPCNAVKIINVESISYSQSRCTYQTVEGTVLATEWSSTQQHGAKFTWYINPCNGSHCIGNIPDYPDYVPGPLSDPIIVRPPNTECVWTITPVDSYVDDRGVYHTKYEVAPNDFNCGSRYWYWDTDGGPYIGPPDTPLVDPPNTAKGSDIPDLPSFHYSMYGNCEKAEDWGEDPDDFEQPVLDFKGDATDGIRGLADRLDALGNMVGWLTLLHLQTCGCEKPKLEGRWVTTQWISEQNSPGGDFPLRKLLRYRTKSSRTNAELAEFFKDFWWDAGPFCVGHKGAWWGTPQVWASTVLEGKRVIKEIAREAGIDPDLEGEWWDSTSRNPRYGMTGRMRLRRMNGYPWVHSREGPDMLPMGDVDP